MPMQRFLPFLMMMICIAALSMGYFLEYVQHLIPCLLCVAQRVALYVIGIMAALLWLFPLQGIKRACAYVLLLMASGIGIYFAGKQLYLESLPPELRPACTIPFEALLQSHEWGAAFMQLIQGTSDCGVRQWVFLNMSLPFWSGLIFVTLFAIGLRAWIIQK